VNFTVAGAGAAATEPATAAAAQHRKLMDAAQQFEGMLLQEMLKPMKEHGFCEGDDGQGEDGQGGGFADTLSSFGTEAAATAIAKGGGLGIAKRVVNQVEVRRLSAARQGGAQAQSQNKL
jgi:flagellar protein FlgJ